jgi:hypothetical protein
MPGASTVFQTACLPCGLPLIVQASGISSFVCVDSDKLWCAGEHCLFPQPKSVAEGIVCATMRRQRFELLDVASPKHCVVGLQLSPVDRPDRSTSSFRGSLRCLS